MNQIITLNFIRIKLKQELCVQFYVKHAIISVHWIISDVMYTYRFYWYIFVNTYAW